MTTIRYASGGAVVAPPMSGQGDVARRAETRRAKPGSPQPKPAAAQHVRRQPRREGVDPAGSGINRCPVRGVARGMMDECVVPPGGVQVRNWMAGYRMMRRSMMHPPTRDIMRAWPDMAPQPVHQELRRDAAHHNQGPPVREPTEHRPDKG